MHFQNNLFIFKGMCIQNILNEKKKELFWRDNLAIFEYICHHFDYKF